MEKWKIGEKQWKTLDDLAVCPVCEYRMIGDRAAVCCVNGHAVCSPCREKLSTCPICREPFLSQGQPTLLRQLLEALPQRCKNKGCNKVVGDDHSKWCDFRNTYCVNCGSIIAVNEYVDHYLTTHPEKFVEGGVKQCKMVLGDVCSEMLLFSVTNEQHLFRVVFRNNKNNISYGFFHILRENMYMHKGVTYKASVGFLKNEADSEPALEMTTVLDLEDYSGKVLTFHKSTFSDQKLVVDGRLQLKISIFENTQQ